MGTGALKLVPLEPGFLVSLHCYSLTEEIVVERRADAQQPERLLFTFHAFDPTRPVDKHASTAQLASTSMAYTTVLPAGLPLRMVAIAVDKTLLTRWLGREQAAPLDLLTTQQPRLVEALLTPEVQAALQDITAVRPPHELDLLFYRLKVQELLYWLLRELAQRAGGPTRPLHAADAAHLLQVLATLLTALASPPRLAELAHAAGMSETKLKHLFRQVFGTSPYAYYQAARLREAKRLLAQVVGGRSRAPTRFHESGALRAALPATVRLGTQALPSHAPGGNGELIWPDTNRIAPETAILSEGAAGTLWIITSPASARVIVCGWFATQVRCSLVPSFPSFFRMSPTISCSSASPELRIGIILGSTRPGRRGDQLAAWVLDVAHRHGGAIYELIDLADYQLGNLDEPGNPNLQQYQHAHTRNWAQLIASFDGYVFLTPEYNHSISGALKNALDYVYKEWNDKAAAIVCYGGWAAEVRAGEALRLILAELQVATMRAQTSVPMRATFATGVFVPDAPLTDSVDTMLTQLLPWVTGMRGVREAKALAVA